MRRASRGRKTLKQTINLLQLNEEKINGYHAIVQEITKVNTHITGISGLHQLCIHTVKVKKEKKCRKSRCAECSIFTWARLESYNS
jgi:hypothetical protein